MFHIYDLSTNTYQQVQDVVTVCWSTGGYIRFSSPKHLDVLSICCVMATSLARSVPEVPLLEVDHEISGLPVGVYICDIYIYIYLCVYVYIYICACMNVYKSAITTLYTYIYIYIINYIYPVDPSWVVLSNFCWRRADCLASLSSAWMIPESSCLVTTGQPLSITLW